MNLIVLVGEDDPIGLCVRPPLVKPLGRILSIPPPILDDSLFERLALPCDFAIPLRLGAFDEGEDGMRCGRFGKRRDGLDDQVAVRVEEMRGFELWFVFGRVEDGFWRRDVLEVVCAIVVAPIPIVDKVV